MQAGGTCALRPYSTKKTIVNRKILVNTETIDLPSKSEPSTCVHRRSMKPKIVAVVVALFVLGGAAMGIGRAMRHSTSDQLSASEALRIMRTLGTAEAESFLTEQKYMSVEQLIRHRFFSARQPEIVLNDTSSGTIKNYRLSVVVSADGKHFTAALVPIEGCGTA